MVARNALPRPRPKPDEQPAVRITNVTCARCDGPVYWSASMWLVCVTCSKPAAGGKVGAR